MSACGTPSEDQPLPAVLEQAAGWLLCLQRPECSAAERRRFEAWLAADPRHSREYARFQELWRQLDGLKPRRRSRRQSLAASLAGFACCGALLGLPTMDRQECLQTAVGEMRSELLADGSRLDLNADTVLRIQYSARQRRLFLERGEARFVVAADARPFSVQAGAATLRDIGTTFAVSRERQSLAVRVLEGRVEAHLGAAPVSIGGGQQWQHGPQGSSEVQPVAPGQVAPWLDGRWVFQATPLAQALAQVNRQHDRPVLLQDPSLAELRISGSFRMADREGLLDALLLLYPLAREEGRDRTYLLRRGGAE